MVWAPKETKRGVRGGEVYTVGIDRWFGHFWFLDFGLFLGRAQCTGIGLVEQRLRLHAVLVVQRGGRWKGV